MWFIAFGEGLK